MIPAYWGGGEIRIFALPLHLVTEVTNSFSNYVVNNRGYLL